MGLSSHPHLGAGWEVSGILVRILTPHREPGRCHGCSAGPDSVLSFPPPTLEKRVGPSSPLGPGSGLSEDPCLSTWDLVPAFQSSRVMSFRPSPAWAPPFWCLPLTPYSYVPPHHPRSPTSFPLLASGAYQPSALTCSPPYPSGHLPGHMSRALRWQLGWSLSRMLLYSQHPTRCQEYSRQTF